MMETIFLLLEPASGVSPRRMLRGSDALKDTGLFGGDQSDGDDIEDFLFEEFMLENDQSLDGDEHLLDLTYEAERFEGGRHRNLGWGFMYR